MDQRYIRAMLRAATSERILTGWQGPHTDQRSYTIAPSGGDASERSLAATIDFVRCLEAAGIGPLYRSSEPVGDLW